MTTINQLTGFFLTSTANVVANSTPSIITSNDDTLDIKPTTYLNSKTGVIKLDTTSPLVNSYPSDTEQINHVNIDSSNNLYIVGQYRGGTIFNNIDGTNSNIELSSYSNNVSRGFLVKYNNGKVVWAVDTVNVGNTALSGVDFLAVQFDSNDDVYVVGGVYDSNTAFAFKDTTNNISPTITNLVSSQGFIVNFTKDGIFKWFVQFDIGGYFSYANFWFNLDNKNNILISSRIRDSRSIKIYKPNQTTGSSLAFEDDTLINSNIQNIYTFRFTSSGQYLQRYIIRGHFDDYIDFALDKEGNMYHTYQYLPSTVYNNNLITFINNYNQTSSVYFDITNDTNVAFDEYRLAISKCNSDGVCQWITKIDTSITASYLRSVNGLIKIDNNGNVIVGFNSEILDASLNGTNMTIRCNNGKQIDVSYNVSRHYNFEGYLGFLAKYNSNGLCQWVTYIDYGNSISNFNIDKYNNIYVLFSTSHSNIQVHDTLDGDVKRTIISDVSNNYRLNYDQLGAILQYSSNGVLEKSWKVGGYGSKDLKTMIFDKEENMYVGIGLIDYNNVSLFDTSDNLNTFENIYSYGAIVVIYDKHGHIIPNYTLPNSVPENRYKTIINYGYPKYYLTYNNQSNLIQNKEYKLEWNGYYWINNNDVTNNETLITVISDIIDKSVITRIDPNSSIIDFRYITYNTQVRYQLNYLVKSGQTFYKDWYFHNYIGRDLSNNNIYSHYLLYTGASGMHSIGFNELKITQLGTTANSETLKIRVYYYKSGDTNNPTFTNYWTITGSEQKIVHIPQYTCIRLMFNPADNNMDNNFSFASSTRFIINKL